MNQANSNAPRRDRFYARTFALASTAVLAYALLKIIQPFIGPLAWAIFIAFLLQPLHVSLTARLHQRPQISAALLTVLTPIVILGPFMALSAAFAVQVGDLLQFAQNTMADQARRNVLDPANAPWARETLVWLDETFNINLVQVQTWIDQGMRQFLQYLASLGGKVFVGAMGTVLGFVLMMFMLFFFVRDGAKMLATMRELIPMSGSYKDKLFDHLAAVTRALVYGTGLTALIQGALVGISFLVVDLPSPLVFSVIAALAALLPFAGTALVWVPAALVLAGQERWGAMIFMILWGTLLVSLVDNVIRPLLVSGRAKVGTLTVFIGVLGGITAFGAIGLFVGPLILALIIALIRFMLEVRRTEMAARGL